MQTQRLALRTGQALVLTPQLRQAIKLLELSNLDLGAYVAQELEENPLLERADDEDGRTAPAGPGARPAAPAPTGTPQPQRRCRPVRSGALKGRLPAGSPGAGNPAPTAAADTLEHLPDRGGDLRAHLMSQLAVEVGDPLERRIGMQLIDLLDEAGYVAGDPGEVARALGCPPERVEAILLRLQRFDPPGIFARSLRECLALQLRERNRLDPAMEALLDHLHLLARGDRRALMRLCRVDAEDLDEMIAELRALDPKPALAFDREAAAPVQPDILVEAAPDGGWIVELNPDTLPRVLVDRAYVARLRGATGGQAERGYLQQRLAAANWLIKSLNRRAETILKVAGEIVRRQDGFLRHGAQHLMPLARREIAAALGLHESTVSRAAAHKFMLTPRGLYELKYFFTPALGGCEKGGAHSAEAVRARIRGLIESERNGPVLSDGEIAGLLREEGVRIARRTVAKYRESMRIPNSPWRRRARSLRN